MNQQGRRRRLLGAAAAAFALLAARPGLADEADTAAKATTDPAGPESSSPGENGRTGSGLGLAPEAPPVGGMLLPARARSERTSVQAGDLKAEFHGFLRAPMRLGIRDDSGTLHINSPLRVPDSEYQSWQYTNTAPGPWVQLGLSVGNPTLTGTVVVGSYSISDAGYHNLSGQEGVFQAFLTLRLPHFANTPTRLEWTVGSFSNRYGAMGKWDAGKYETVIMGRTHLLGETVSLSRDFGPYIVSVEHGLGAKGDHLLGDVGSLTNTTNPDLYGEGHLGATLAHHAHVGLAYRSLAQLGLHYLHSFTHEQIHGLNDPSRLMPDAGTTIVGADLRFDAGAFGYGYVGYSVADMKNLLYLQNAIEALHSFGGVATTANFFPSCDLMGRAPPPGSPAGTANTDLICSGNIQSIGAQYTLSIGALLRRPEPFFGNGPDLVVSVFGIWNKVKGRDDVADVDTQKLKFGFDLTYVPLAWLAISGRYDHVAPDTKDSAKTFDAISPRLVFRTSVFSNEQVVLGYTRYFLNDKVSAPAPNAGLMGTQLDSNLVYLAATMWW